MGNFWSLKDVKTCSEERCHLVLLTLRAVPWDPIALIFLFCKHQEMLREMQVRRGLMAFCSSIDIKCRMSLIVF